MKVYLYSYYDKIAKCFGKITCETQPVENIVEGLSREIPKICKDEKILAQYKDRILFVVGVMDDNTGEIITCKEGILDFDNAILNYVGEVSHDEKD